MTNTTELREDFKTSVNCLYALEAKTIDPALLDLIANNFDHFCSIGIEAAEKAKVEEVIEYLQKNYGHTNCEDPYDCCAHNLNGGERMLDDLRKRFLTQTE